MGHEVIGPETVYHWDGLKRAASAGSPFWLFQYSLRGWGILETGGAERVAAGSAFLVTIPSRHCYHRDPACEAWEFVWLMVRLPEINQRLGRHPELRNSLQAYDPEGTVLHAMWELALLLEGRAGNFRLEGALFRWCLALEQTFWDRRHPDAPRRQLLEAVRRQLFADLSRPLDVESLARGYAMSRSHFSHYFRRLTGLSPANYLRTLRLEAATERLRDRRLSVKEIAAATGFSDANQFCRAFRRQYRMSPGEWRRLAGT